MDHRLSEIEESVCDIMEVAKQTLEKLQHLPICEESEIAALSTKYLDLVALVQEKMKSCSNEILSSSLTPEKAPYADLLKEYIENQRPEAEQGHK